MNKAAAVRLLNQKDRVPCGYYVYIIVRAHNSTPARKLFNTCLILLYVLYDLSIYSNVNNKYDNFIIISCTK